MKEINEMASDQNSAVPGVRKRPFPFPYRSALAICSDIDLCNLERFTAVHHFLNDPEKGLGIPVADSMFAVGVHSGQMAYFTKDGETPSTDAPFLREAIRNGLIDSLHSWGDFNHACPDPVFLSRTAENFAREFSTHGLTLPIWINHGSPLNRQNFRARLRTQYEGDSPLSPYDTLQFAYKIGVKYYWWSEVVSWPLSSHHAPMAALTGRFVANGFKNMIKRIQGKNTVIKPGFLLSALGGIATMGNESKLIGFTRYNRHPDGMWGRPSRFTFRYSLSRTALADLLRYQGYAIIYTHLALPVESSTLFEKPDIAALEHLADNYRSGNIWVETTSRLLRYWLVDRTLSWKASRIGNKIVIDLSTVLDPHCGNRPPVSEELSGICFYTPEPAETILRLQEKELSVQSYPADATGKMSVGIATQTPPSTKILEK